MASMNFTQFPGMNQLRSNPNPQNSFTFTAPTQCTTLGTPRPCIQTMSPINLTAPGVGASWQHSIPNTMPWVDIKPAVQANTKGSTTFFTGLPCNMMPVQTPPEELSRAPKRKADCEPQDIPLSKIHVCADQFANMRISPQNQASNASLEINGYGFCSAADVTVQPQNQIEQWERFRELESRLAVDGEEKFDTGSTSEVSSQAEAGVRVSVAEGVLNIVQNSPILPRSVMESINKPCMQLVLWQSPEKLIRDASEDCNASDAIQTSCCDQAESRTSDNLPSTKGSVSSVDSKGLFKMDTQAGCGQESSLPILAASSNEVDNNMCSNFSSSGFLRPSLSTSAQAQFSQTHTPGFAFGTSASSQQRRNGYMNLNNNNELTVNNNAMDMFDSIDDDMQL